MILSLQLLSVIKNDVKIRPILINSEFILFIMNLFNRRYAYSNLNLEFLYTSLWRCTTHFNTLKFVGNKNFLCFNPLKWMVQCHKDAYQNSRLRLEYAYLLFNKFIMNRINSENKIKCRISTSFLVTKSDRFLNLYKHLCETLPFISIWASHFNGW